jgi:uncharacterized protein (TIGR02594 family)
VTRPRQQEATDAQRELCLQFLKAAGAEAEAGVREAAGKRDNPRVLEYLRSVQGRRPPWFVRDSTPWCSAFANWTVQGVGIAGTGKPNARSWLSWGIEVDHPCDGAVAVLWRGVPAGPQGHVAFVCDPFPRPGRIQLLGGNQGNRVGLQLYPLRRVLGYRVPAVGA